MILIIQSITSCIGTVFCVFDTVKKRETQRARDTRERYQREIPEREREREFVRWFRQNEKQKQKQKTKKKRRLTSMSFGLTFHVIPQ